MRKLVLVLVLVAGLAAVIIGLGGHSNSARAQVAGEWTHCILNLTDGRQVNVVNGQSSEAQCIEKAKKCAEAYGGSYTSIQWFDTLVIINAPYERCQS